MTPAVPFPICIYIYTLIKYILWHITLMIRLWRISWHHSYWIITDISAWNLHPHILHHMLTVVMPMVFCHMFTSNLVFKSVTSSLSCPLLLLPLPCADYQYLGWWGDSHLPAMFGGTVMALAPEQANCHGHTGRLGGLCPVSVVLGKPWYIPWVSTLCWTHCFRCPELLIVHFYQLSQVNWACRWMEL